MEGVVTVIAVQVCNNRAKLFLIKGSYKQIEIIIVIEFFGYFGACVGAV